MDEMYPELEKSLKGKIKPSMTKTYMSQTNMATNIQSKDTLDLVAIIKASQAISSEIVYKNLIDKLMKTIVESAGAESILLLTKKEDNFVIEANYSVNSNTKSGFPASIINFVERTKELLILDDVSQKSDFKNDKYIRENKLKSVLCMPLMYQGNISKILYIENNLSTGAFTEDRVGFLNLISSQMVISLENSKVYEHLEELVIGRTKELSISNKKLEESNKKLGEMATHDALTGLPNRKLFEERLSSALDFAKRHKLFVGILFIDLDGFKMTNDTLGHDAGDIVLKTVAIRLTECVRECDTVSRLGGDEFTIILGNLTEISTINRVCERILEKIGEDILLGKNIGHVTSSIGVSVYPDFGQDMNELIKKADKAMYMAKKSGMNKFLFYGE